MIRKIICILVLISAMGATLSYGQNTSAILTSGTLTGSISEIDWVAGTIAVRTYDFDNELDEVKFRVTQNTKIIKGTETIYLSDLQQSDNVVVTYFSTANSFAGLRAESISVTN
jgi:hypothetical protein